MASEQQKRDDFTTWWQSPIFTMKSDKSDRKPIVISLNNNSKMKKKTEIKNDSSLFEYRKENIDLQNKENVNVNK